MRYGIVTEIDERSLDTTIALVLKRFPTGPLHFAEVGTALGGTCRGVCRQLEQSGRSYDYLATDRDFGPWEGLVPPKVERLLGDSFDVGCAQAPESRHWVFIDGCHDFVHVLADFWAWKHTVVPGGLLLFHDSTARADLTYWQGHGSKDNPLRYVAVRKALEAWGLLGGRHAEFEVALDEPGPYSSGGVTAFRRK